MVAQVIPYRRTVRGVEWFEYEIPDGLVKEVRPGSLVRVDFRGKALLGLVNKVAERPVTTATLKPVLEVLPHRWWQAAGRLEWLRWFAEYYYVSLAHAFYTLQFPLVRRPRRLTVLPTDRAPQAPEAALTERQKRAVTELLGVSRALLWYSRREGCLAAYRGLVARVTGHTLLLVPDRWTAASLARQFNKSRVRMVVDRQSGSQWYHLVPELEAREEGLVVIATRQGVLLPLQLFELVVVDQEEVRSHKQYEMNPRFHLREVVIEQIDLLRKGGTAVRLVCSSLAPSVRVYHRAQAESWAVVELRQRRKRPIEVVDMEKERIGGNYSWFSHSLREALGGSEHALLFLNRVGSFRAAHCRDCQALLAASAVRCSDCGGGNLYRSGRGTAQLERDLNEMLPAGKSVVRIDRDQLDLSLGQSAVREADVVVATEKIFGVLPLAHFDLVAVLSIDHLLVLPHFQAAERTAQLFTRLAATEAAVLLQTSAPHHSVVRALAEDKYELVLSEELRIRKEMNLPPFAPAAVVLDKKTGLQQRLRELPERSKLDSHVTIDRADA